MRNPPRLATWLLNRCGFARQNPPLTGDLLEEFRNGRSSAWLWRQTLVAILTGMIQNARLFRRLLIANIVGWAAQAGVTFALWWFHYPRQLHGISEAIAAIPVTILVFLALFFPKVLTPKGQAKDDILSSTETARRLSRAEDEDDERLNRWLRRALLAMYGCVQFFVFLSVYCLAALFDTVPLGLLVYLQTWGLFCAVKDILANDTNPSAAKMFTTLK
jgi:hypothetical protein